MIKEKLKQLVIWKYL